MSAPKHASSLRLRYLSLAAASALPLIASIGLAGTAQAEILVNKDISRLLQTGQIGTSSGFTLSPIDLGSASGVTLHEYDQDLADGPNAVTAPYDLYVGGISGDGTTVIGTRANGDGTNTPFVWTAASGLTYLDTGSLTGNFSVDAVSDNGTAFAGILEGVAFYWNNGMTRLGTMDGASSSVEALSGDGSTVVGYVQYEQDGHIQGFVWQRDSGDMTPFGFLEGGTFSWAFLTSYDGSVVGGMSTDATGNDRAVRWTAADERLVSLGTLEGDGQVRLNAMNRDGSVMVGRAGYQPDGQGASNHAFRWSLADETMHDIHGTGFIESEARAVSEDGAVVVGSASMLQQSDSSTTPPPAPGGGGASTVERGFRWTQETGMITVDQWLRDAGVTVADDFSGDAFFVSADGKTIVGNKIFSRDVYIAHVGDTSGAITIGDYITSAAQTNSVAIGLQTSSASTIMFGAQGSPMRNLLEVGRRSAWGTVDTGYDSGSKSEGGLVLGDFGFGYGLMDGITVRLQGGATHTDQDLYDGGDFQANSWYVAPEVTANLLGDLYLTVGGLYGRGKLDINRGYQNGTGLDFSSGDTNTETLAGKLRFDWLNAVSLGDAAFTPYLALSRTLAKTDAYVETGGSFPATHDEASEHATIARLGVDGAYKLNDSVTLLARAEAAYRFEDQTSGTSTEVAGVKLSVAGEDIKQFWLRGGIGTEIAIGGGVASFMLNATTESEDPDVWLRSGWKVDF